VSACNQKEIRGNQRGEFRERKGMREEREAEGRVALGWGRGWDGVVRGGREGAGVIP
jgi:hypothetical protein